MLLPLTYQYILPAISPVRTLGDFKPVAEALQKLHNTGYVNSDVRMANIAFNDDENTKFDFNLTDKIDFFYPERYNTYFSEHHKDANRYHVWKI